MHSDDWLRLLYLTKMCIWILYQTPTSHIMQYSKYILQRLHHDDTYFYLRLCHLCNQLNERLHSGSVLFFILWRAVRWEGCYDYHMRIKPVRPAEYLLESLSRDRLSFALFIREICKISSQICSNFFVDPKISLNFQPRRRRRGKLQRPNPKAHNMSAPVFSDAAVELALYAENTEAWIKPAWLTLGKFYRKGTFNRDRAIAYVDRYVLIPAAKQYRLEFCGMREKWDTVFPKPSRLEAADSIVSGMVAEFKLGNFWS